MKLKPCPFCGGVYTLVIDVPHDGWLAVRCVRTFCGAFGPYRRYRKTAIKAWNRRVK